MVEKHVLRVPGRYDQIRKITRFVARGARQAGLGEDAVFHVELCCDEACTNIIEHAYGEEDAGAITVSFEADDEAFTITIHDSGHAFDPGDVPAPATADTLAASELTMDNLKVGGLGLHFIRKLMDDVRFSFDGSAGNTLVMIKKLVNGKRE